jgi:2,4-dienoyl-CoA reductase-like NADH-dependent reductase (Old Yellow Enzyme family)
MSKLFETMTIKNLQLDNRFVRSATNVMMAGQDGSCTPELVDTMAKLAQGGVGLIITGHAYVLKGGQAGFRQAGCYNDHLLPGLSKMAQAVHAAGGVIALQIAHGGILANAELSGEEPLGPSALQIGKGPVGSAMTKAEIERTVEAFAAAASRAVQAGYDAVQIHAAHGYLLSQFLSPYFNHRTDEYGGSLENRARMLLQVLRAVQDVVGDEYPVFVKMNSEDLLDGGLSREEMVEVCTLLQQAGIDAIELSGGTSLGLRMNKLEITPFPIGNGKVYWQEAAEQYKSKIDVPLMLVGGIRSFETAEELVDSGVADFVSLCRPLIREPDLVKRWETGDRRKADCIRDNACGFAALKEGKGVHCVHLDRA